MNSNGYTLLEMIMVIVIIGILASVAVQSLQNSSENDRLDSTLREMEIIARAIVGDDRLISNGYRNDFGYVGDIGALPANLDALVANPGGYATWNGPYIRGRFAEDIDGYKSDAWGNVFTFSGVAIGSSGGGSSITKQFAASVASLIANTVTGFVRDVNGAPPGDSASNVIVSIYYPDGSGSISSSSVTPTKSGEFSFSGMIPIGIHQIRAVNSGTTDTTSYFAAVNPGSVSLSELRFTTDLWSSAVGGSGSGWIRYVIGSAINSGPGNSNIEFDIENAGSFPVTLNSVILTFTSSPASYFRRITWDSNNIYNNPRLGSGEIAVFSSPQIMNPSEIITVTFDGFKDNPGGGGSFVDMSGISFQIIFSNGDSFDFVTP